MDKLFHVVIAEVDGETKEETVKVDETYTGLMMLADKSEGSFASSILHDTIFNIATKLAANEDTAKAARIAVLMMDLEKDKAESRESKLLRAIMEG